MLTSRLTALVLTLLVGIAHGQALEMGCRSRESLRVELKEKQMPPVLFYHEEKKDALVSIGDDAPTSISEIEQTIETFSNESTYRKNEQALLAKGTSPQRISQIHSAIRERNAIRMKLLAGERRSNAALFHRQAVVVSLREPFSGYLVNIHEPEDISCVVAKVHLTDIYSDERLVFSSTTPFLKDDTFGFHAKVQPLLRRMAERDLFPLARFVVGPTKEPRYYGCQACLVYVLGNVKTGEYLSLSFDQSGNLSPESPQQMPTPTWAKISAGPTITEVGKDIARKQ